VPGRRGGQPGHARDPPRDVGQDRDRRRQRGRGRRRRLLGGPAPARGLPLGPVHAVLRRWGPADAGRPPSAGPRPAGPAGGRAGPGRGADHPGPVPGRPGRGGGRTGQGPAAGPAPDRRDREPAGRRDPLAGPCPSGPSRRQPVRRGRGAAAARYPHRDRDRDPGRGRAHAGAHSGPAQGRDLPPRSRAVADRHLRRAHELVVPGRAGAGLVTDRSCRVRRPGPGQVRMYSPGAWYRTG